VKEETVIPLKDSVTLTTGEVVREVRVKKGTLVHIP
jgi:hypothetical protein